MRKDISSESADTAKKSTLGGAIRRARKEVGMSQKELAERLGMSDKTVSAYEVDRATPSFEALLAIGRVLNKQISYFDPDAHTVDIDLHIMLSNIEKELLEVKKLLKKAQ